MKTIPVDGTEIFCSDRGDGPPLLLVQGFPLDHTMWAELDVCSTAAPGCERSPVTAEGGCPTEQMGTVLFSSARLIAPDLRGFGRSPARGETVTMERFADDLVGLLDALGIDEPVVFCGLSMGGYIALQFWLKYPQRIRGLVLCDTRAAADTPKAAAARGVMAERVLREGTAPLVEMMSPKLVAESTKQRNPQVLEGLRRVMTNTDPRVVAAVLRGMAERPDMTTALGEIKCPTLIIVGREDVFTPPAEMRGMAEAVPGAKYVEIPDAGHLAPLENPAAVSAALAEFIQGI